MDADFTKRKALILLPRTYGSALCWKQIMHQLLYAIYMPTVKLISRRFNARFIPLSLCSSCYPIPANSLNAYPFTSSSST